jgi:hypothetical protein
MNKASSLVLYIAISTFPSATAEAKRDLMMNGSLTLADGRKLVLKHAQSEAACWEMSLRARTGKYLWDRTFCTDFDLLWLEPFFVPIKADRYELDLNRDGYPEIGVAVWDGGNAPMRWAIIFTVEEKSLRPYGRKKYNIESNDPLLP